MTEPRRSSHGFLPVHQHCHSKPEPLTFKISRHLQRCYVTLRHAVVITDVTWKRHVIRSVATLAATAVLLMTLLSTDGEEPPTGFAIDSALLRQVQRIDFSGLLCWEDLQRPFFAKMSLRMEVGQNVMGTPVHIIPAFRWKPSEKTAIGSGWPKKIKRRGNDSNSPQLRTLTSMPPPYSHTESQSVMESRVNQMASPSPAVDNTLSSVHMHGRLVAHQAYKTPWANRKANRSRRSVGQQLQPSVNLNVIDRSTGLSNESFHKKSHQKLIRNRERRKQGSETALVNRPGLRPEQLGPHPPHDNNQRRRDVTNPRPGLTPALTEMKLHSSPSPRRKSITSGRNQSAAGMWITKPCRRFRFKDMIVTSQCWEPLAEDDDNVFVYSAFYQKQHSVKSLSESRHKVRVLGLCVWRPLEQHPHVREEVFCHYRWTPNPDLHVIQPGHIVSIMDGGNARYHAIFVVCDLHLCARPDYVGITLHREATPRSYFPVTYPPSPDQGFKHNLTVCLPVIHAHFRDRLGLLKALEARGHTRADKFIIYVHEASPEMTRILQHYVSSGVMEAVEWRLPFPVSAEESEREGEKATLSDMERLLASYDCLSSASLFSRHVKYHEFNDSETTSHQPSRMTDLLYKLFQKV